MTSISLRHYIRVVMVSLYFFHPRALLIRTIASVFNQHNRLEKGTTCLSYNEDGHRPCINRDLHTVMVLG